MIAGLSMAAFQKFQPFVQALANKAHDLSNDTLKVALTNTQPTAVASVFGEITEVAAGNGYTSGGNVTTTVTNVFLVFCPCLAIIPVLRVPK